MTVMVEKRQTTLGAIPGTHPDVQDLPASVLDGLGDHEGDLDMAGKVAAEVYNNWDDDTWRNAFLMALSTHIENQVAHHHAELEALYNKAKATVYSEGRRAVVKAYLNDVLNGVVEKAEWEDRLHPRGQGGQFTYSNREHQAALSAAMLHAQSQMTGGDQEWEFTIRKRNGDVKTNQPGAGKLPRLQMGDRVVHARLIKGTPAPLTRVSDTMNMAEALGANRAQAGSAGAVVDEMQRQGMITYGSNSWFDRLGSASETMHRATNGRGGIKVQVALAMGKAVGKHGPEVSRVLGPHMRRYTYKYRGTAADPTQWTPLARRGPGETSKGVKQTPEEYRDQLTLNLAHPRGKGGGFEGLDAIPTEAQNDTMLKTGSTPPSHGYILDRHGKVVSQAHGYADDHYVPFNLKHVGALNGGSYTRSRAFGGPTTEDIALAMKTGATGFNVISRNGIYKVDFTERTNKAGRKIGAWAKDTTGDANQIMVNRYARLLDAVKNGKISDPENGQPVTLNGRGYELALKSLQKQFPYFIRDVRYVPGNDIKELEGKRASEANTDTGYVRPYYIKPHEAVQGWYDEKLGGHSPFDEHDAYRLGKARVFAAKKKAVDARAAADRAAAQRPVNREMETKGPSNLPQWKRDLYGAAGGDFGAAQPSTPATQDVGREVWSSDKAAKLMGYVKAMLDHVDSSDPDDKALHEQLGGLYSSDPKMRDKYDDLLDAVTHDRTGARAALWDALDSLGNKLDREDRTGLDIYHQAVHDEDLVGRPEDEYETPEDIEGTADHDYYKAAKRYLDLRKARANERQKTGDEDWNFPNNKGAREHMEAWENDHYAELGGRTLAQEWTLPHPDWDGLTKVQAHENRLHAAKQIQDGVDPNAIKDLHEPPEDYEPNPKGPSADEEDMDESTRKRREADREDEAERYAREASRWDKPPF